MKVLRQIYFGDYFSNYCTVGDSMSDSPGRERVITARRIGVRGQQDRGAMGQETIRYVANVGR